MMKSIRKWNERRLARLEYKRYDRLRYEMMDKLRDAGISYHRMNPFFKALGMKEIFEVVKLKDGRDLVRWRWNPAVKTLEPTIVYER